jgi:hypothetical protein
MWAHRFDKWFPEHLRLGLVKQRIKELKRIQAENAGMLAHWYDQLANVILEIALTNMHRETLSWPHRQGSSAGNLLNKSHLYMLRF